MKKYEQIEHTADIGIKVYGKDLKELFCNAALGMYEQIAGLESVKPSEKIQIDIEASDYEELLVLWLSEVLYQYNGKGKLLNEFVIEKLSEKHIASYVKGEAIDPKRHSLKKEVKAVTFHNVKIEKGKNYFTTELIFDV